MAYAREARARLKIDALLKEAGWRFFDDEKEGRANIQLESQVKISRGEREALGYDFEKTHKGFVDYLLLNDKNFPLVVLEAKREHKNPLDGKEQARIYAGNNKARFIILSNGNLHYLWDTESGDPYIITKFPTQESLMHRCDFVPSKKSLAEEVVENDYIALSQNPYLQDDPEYRNEKTRGEYISKHGIQILRPYQVQAIHSLQKAAAEGKDRFLFEMATGTGKTLISAAVIKLFLRTANAKRILFLVDRLELEDQAHKNFNTYLQKDFESVVYKQNRDDWKKADIVISTVQSLTFQNKYKALFSPTDFDLIIADESHRAISGNSRAVFEYFIGYKLGLTATPKNYLKNIDPNTLASRDPRAWERRQLLDTYVTFGCKDAEPTFRYSLPNGVKEGFLINSITVDARTNISTELLSKEGYSVVGQTYEGENIDRVFYKKDFERRFVSEKTNYVFCKALLEKALRDQMSGEIGKSIVFCVTQEHASKITQTLNKIATEAWPEKYNSDFAVQVTSNVVKAAYFAKQFAKNDLNGKTKFLDDYKTSKTRVCVTVGMMTTGYDCPDILNLVLMRPVFSPTDFIQMKGRGTRRHTFEYQGKGSEEKHHFKLFDFFANCEYFEEEFNYDEVLQLSPIERGDGEGAGDAASIDAVIEQVTISDPDAIKTLRERPIGSEGMKIDRKFFEDAKKEISADEEIKTAVENERWDEAVSIIRAKYENHPTLFLNLETIRESENLDRQITWREVLERIFGFRDGFKSKQELLEDECQKFIAIKKPESEQVMLIKNFIKAYISDEEFERIIKEKRFAALAANSSFTMAEFKALGEAWRESVPKYIQDYVNLDQFRSNP